MNTNNFATLGILAHVDAGKTTLSESLLLNCGKIREAGRVDKGDAFLDTDPIEKERGITIFSKQAVFDLGNINVTLLDTPGHVDFSAEAERILSVLDVAVLLVSGPNGLQAHTRTLAELLKLYNIPVIIFVNKMDQPGTDKALLFKELKAGFSPNCVDFTDFNLKDENFLEEIAASDELLLEKFLEGELTSESEITDAFYERKFFPVFFGSALKNEGVNELIDGMKALIRPYVGNEEFGARVFKISRDDKEERLTYLRVTGGRLEVKGYIGEEKVNAIRVYDGAKYTNISVAESGQVVAIPALADTTPGQGIGFEKDGMKPLLIPVISYELILPEGTDMTLAWQKLKNLQEEQPDLALDYNEHSKTIDIRLMGEVQTEILKRRIKERFNLDVSFGESRIIYKETITNTVEGVGHFEPLRHYAEVHLLMEPAEEGSGLILDTDCSEDILDKNWQRLILTHLGEKAHRGVLTGSVITDMKITVVSGRAHNKHTEGGDFRQATYRAVRQGLMQAESKLLEPFYDFELTIPTNFVGRAMTDLEQLHARDFMPETYSDYSVLKGVAPVSTLSDYGSKVAAYTSGLGKLTLSVKGYGPCHNAEEIIEKMGYDPERDVRNSPDSVFCANGTSDIVPWNEVKNRMHMPSVLNPVKELTEEQIRIQAQNRAARPSDGFVSVEEVDKIIGSISANQGAKFVPNKGIGHKPEHKHSSDEKPAKPYKAAPVLPEHILVDGYNVIFAWDDLKGLASVNIDSARDRLLHILSDYQAMRGAELTVVFDAYRRVNNPIHAEDFNNIHVVFTKTDQTADKYIERFANQNGKKYRLTVVTSDGLEQIVVRGANALVMSSREFKAEVNRIKQDFNAKYNISVHDN